MFDTKKNPFWPESGRSDEQMDQRSTHYLLQFFKGVRFKRHPSMDGLSGNCAEPGRPPSSDLLPFQVLVQVVEPEAERAVAIGASLPGARRIIGA